MSKIYQNNHYQSTSLALPDEVHETSLAEELAHFTPEELAIFEASLQNFELASTLAGHELDREMVDMDQWLDDEYYMGSVTRSMYGVWRDDLIEVFDSKLYSTAIITGSTGTGKSFFSHLAILRMIYEASCLADPARSYGLATGSIIGFCTIASSKETARRVVFEGIISKMKESPYFKYDFPPLKENKDEIGFAKGLNIIAGSSTDTSILGMNIFGGVMDEGNFVRTNTNSVSSSTYSAAQRQKNLAKAERLYASILRRMKSRFNRFGKLPGLFCVLSSKTTNDSFTEKLISDARSKTDTTVFVRDRSLVDVKRDYFSKETFKVLVGNESYPSKILASGEDVSAYGKKALIISVPEDLRTDFETNLEESLRDLLGVSTVAISSFMGRVDLIDRMKDSGRSHPFICPLMANPMEWDSRLPFRINWQKLARQRDNGEWEPLINPAAPRIVHLDPASTGDAFGLAIGHISHQVPVTEVLVGGDPVVEYQPFFIVDFILRVRGTPGEEVLFKNVRKLIYQFSEHGFHIARVTTDSYQSREMIQALQDQGYNAEFLSVDTSKEPYRYLRRAIYDERIKCYDYPQLYLELKELEDNPAKIDHKPGAAKDLADSLCGMTWSAFQYYGNQQPVLPMKGASEVQRPEAIDGSDEFAQLEAEDRGEAVAQQQPKVYVKKAPKTIAPKYQKRNNDGSAEDLTKAAIFDPEEIMVRG